MLKMIYETYKNFLTKLVALFFPWRKKTKGNLCVSGKGYSKFFFADYVQDVSVYFTDQGVPAPCNPCDPGREDDLYWKLKEREDCYILTIHWDVSSMRHIAWEVET